MRAFRAVSGILSESRQDKSTARLALVIVGHLLFAFTTATFGIFGRRVDAVAHALHTLFECAALVFCLLSMLNSVTHGTTTSYSFGTQRLEVLSAFCVAIVNLFFALFAGGEGIVHYVTALVPVLHAEKVDSKAHELLKHHDHEHLHTTVLQFGRVGLALFSVVLLFRPAFARALSEHDSHSFVSLNARELNIRAAFIHCVSVLVRAIAAPLASTCGDWNFPGVEVSIILLSTALCVLLNWKLCRATTLILSQTVPPHLHQPLEKCIREICTIDGVLECRQYHFWSLSHSAELVGTVHLRARSDVDETTLLTRTVSILNKYVKFPTVQIEKDATMPWLAT